VSPRGHIRLTCRCNGFQEIAQSSHRFRAQCQPNEGCVGGNLLWADASVTLTKGTLVDDNDVCPSAPQEVEGLLGAAGPHNVRRLLEDRL
jgi:hypothetical protein